MRTKLIRIFMMLCLLFFVLSLAVSQEAIKRAVDSINQHLILREYERAQSYASFILRFYRANPMPLETLDAVERATEAWANDLAARREWHRIVELEAALAEAPASVKNKLMRPLALAREGLAQVQSSAQLEAEKQRLAQLEAQLRLEQASEAAREAQRQEEQLAAVVLTETLQVQRAQASGPQASQLERLLQEARQTELEREAARRSERELSENRQLELQGQLREAEEDYRRELVRLFETVSKGNVEALNSVATSNRTIVYGLIVVAAIILLGGLMLVIFALRQQKMQHEQYKNTLQAMQAMRNTAPDLGLLALPAGQQLLLESGPGSMAASGESIKKLLEKCQGFGQEIDKITGRRNASRLVADLVYKISRQLGHSESDAVLFFAVGLVYDIGFLNVDPLILRSEQISEDQFAQIKTHTTLGSSMVFFVDEEHRSLFKNGVSMHHENLDGSGYPSGLKGEAIPFIARLLRVAESYIALISSREYRQIRDRNAAMQELVNNSAHYDQTIVNALNEIV